MKKHLTILSFAVTMFMAFTASFTLTSCGEEVIIDPPKKKTKFSAGTISPKEDGTRTSMDKSRVFYWQTNDQIWVNHNGTWIKSDDSELSTDSKAANFYFGDVLEEPSYTVLYTGYNSTSATQVTIPSAFTTTNGDGSIGWRGDCGVATATPNGDGTYSFALEHKGSYLGVAPLLQSYSPITYKWTKIEITETDGKTIAGTFAFSADGIDVTSVTSPASKVTITAMANQNTYLQKVTDFTDYIYLVLPPSERTLNIKYYFVKVSDPTNEMVLSRTMNTRNFRANGVTLLKHALTPDYYQWDASAAYPMSELAESAFHELQAPNQATQSCASMPNVNELYWYFVNGDPRWDNETKWSLDGGYSENTGGVWIKKKSVILAEGKTFDSNIGKNGVDARVTYMSHYVNNDTYKTGGKPADTSKYFFLPAAGNKTSVGDIVAVGEAGRYWSSSPAPGNIGYYKLDFNSDRIAYYNDNGYSGLMVRPEWFQ